MKRINKMALAAIAATALAASAQAQYNSGDLLLGFTTSASHGDLVIDLGSFASLTSGDLNTSGHTGFANDAALATALGANGLSLNSLSWGVVGGFSTVPSAPYGIYTTVAHGTAFPTLAQSSIPNAVGDNDTLGNSIGSGKQAITDPTAQNGNSVSEVWHNSAGTASLQVDWIDPTTATSGTFGTGLNYLSEDLYYQAKGAGAVDVGTFTLGSDGSLTFAATAVPEPATFGLFGGFGLLLLALRRQFARKAS
jgi:hypothetical protein